VSTYRPLIAVVAYHLANDRVTRWPEGGYGVPAPYIDAIRRAGARTAIVSPGEIAEPADILGPFDGLLLVGGGDVDPSRYGAQPDTEHNYGVEPDRDDFEIALLREAARTATPTLCVCRGMQVMNVAFGGTLHQHLPAVGGLIEHGVPLEGTETIHDVDPVPRTRLSATTKSGTLACSSHHHQGVDRVGDVLMVTGRSSDGLVEAIELEVEDMEDPLAPWMLGVQWHPEETAADDPAQQSLFDALTVVAKWHGDRPGGSDRGTRGRTLEIVDPDPAWPDRFELEAARIVRAIPRELVVSIDHVGSTSVPGLAAKPTVDIQLSVSSMVPRASYAGPLAALGYLHVLDPTDDDHEYFKRDVDGRRAFQIHVCPAGSAWERRHLAFREWLRGHPEDADAYGALKRRLAAEHPRDPIAYTRAKTDFIRALTEKALTTS
jgi:putative glutamine amidotransferase